MPVVFRIAFRNLRQHRSKTLIIGIIIAVGTLILVVGNSLMDTAELGIEQAFINNYTGHIFISSVAEGDVSIFGVQSVGGIEETPVLPHFEEIREYLESRPQILGLTTQVTGFAGLKSEEQIDVDAMMPTLLFGINPEEYHRVFDNLTVTEGHYLAPGEAGIMISRTTADSINETLGIDLKVGDRLLLNGFGSAGFRIREVVVRGIFTFKQEGEAADLISYIDAQTLRALKGMNLGKSAGVILTEEETGLLDTPEENSFDVLFSGDLLFADENAGETDITEDIYAILDEGEVDVPGPAIDSEPVDGGETTWEYFLITLKHPSAGNRIIRETNAWFSEQGISAQAGGWKAAAGPFSKSADAVRIVFNVAVIMVVVVAVIIVINTLVISVVERTGEIGTMRALGAQRSFIRRLFSMEVSVISTIFGFIGIAAGILALLIIRLIGFEAGNPFVEILFAGKVLKPVIYPISLIITLLGVIAFGILANLYPLRLALKVQPVKAMQNE